MNKLVRTILSSTIVFGITVSPALADGFYYFATDIGQSETSDICSGSFGGAGCNDKAGLLRVSGGFQFARELGTEISYGYYGKESLGAGASSSNWKASGFQIAGIYSYSLPTENKWSVSAKLGMALTKLDLTSANSSDTNTNLTWGVGVRYDLSHEVGVRLLYEKLGDIGNASNGDANLKLITAGIVLNI